MKTYRGRENYYKYFDLREQLEQELQKDQTSKEIAKNLQITATTFHKYRNLFQLEVGMQYMTKDERAFMASKKMSTEIPGQSVIKVSDAISVSGFDQKSIPAQESVPAAPVEQEKSSPSAKRKKK